MAVGKVWVTLSTEEAVKIDARLVDDANAQRGCNASQTVDPTQTIVVAGSLRELVMSLN